MPFNPLVQFANTGKQTLLEIMEASREKASQSLEAVKCLGAKTQDFIVSNGNKVALAVGTVIMVGAPNRVMAADDAWFTALTDKLTSVQTMVGTVVAAVVAIALVPIAWGFIKKAIGRG